VHRAVKAFNPKFQCLNKEGNKFYLPNGRTGSDDLVEVLHDQCHWNNATNLDFLAKWYYIDYEFAENTTSMLSLPMRRYSIGPFFFVKEQDGGFESVARRFAEDTFGEPLDATIKFSNRVSKIDYDLIPSSNGGYSALIEATQASGCPIQYRAKRVVLTTSVGVIASGDIAFSPSLKYKKNPLEMKDYIKIFYQFKVKFWDDAQFIVSLQKEENIGMCHHWQNLDFKSNARGARKQTSPEFLPGSGILFCTLLTEAVKELDGGKLTDILVKGELLDPLRRVYGDQVVNDNLLDSKYHKWNEDENFYGSYSNWQPGSDLVDYFKFYGGIFYSSGKFIDTCGHNGCNSEKEWILHISGTASCIELWELVKGAIAAGKRSAHYVLNDIGCGGSGCDIEFESPCEDFLSNL
jgi:hypothetical protein